MSTNVTVNGRPLEEHLSEEQGREIAELRAADEKAGRVRNHAVTKRMRNHSNGKTTLGQVIYQAGQRETHVIVAGNLFLWQDKAPYVRSGHSLLGAVEYDAKTDRIKCATCGQWVQSISAHVGNNPSSHKTIRDYRLRHGFRLSSKLNTPALSAKIEIRMKPRLQKGGRFAKMDRTISSNRTSATRRERHAFGISAQSETFNLVAKCKAQRLARLKSIADELGRSPTYKELRGLGDAMDDTSLRSLFGVSMRNIFIQAGIAPPKIGSRPGEPRMRKNIGPRLRDNHFLSDKARRDRSKQEEQTWTASQ